MAAQFFGEFLLAQGLIDQSTVELVLEIQKKSNLMLGEIAVAEGLINQQQADEINYAQQVENKRFGEIATEMGLIDSEQINQLLLTQKKKRKFFGGILVEQGFLTQEALDKQLLLHEKAHNHAYQEMLVKTQQHPLVDYLSAAIDTTNLLFQRVLHKKCKFAEFLTRDDLKQNQDPSLFQVSAQITLENSHHHAISITTAEQTAITIASLFTQHPIELCDAEFAQDAFGEFLNIIVGQLVDHKGIKYDANRSATQHQLDINQFFVNENNLLAAKMCSQIGGYMIIVTSD